MTTLPSLDGWPGEPAFIVGAVSATGVEIRAQGGDDTAMRPWASVGKLLAAWGVARRVASGRFSYDEPTDDEGTTLRDLLSHAGGRGVECGDPRRPAREQRIYSNCGIDEAVNFISSGRRHALVLESEVVAPLGLRATSVSERLSTDVVGSTADLARVAQEYLAPSTLSRQLRDEIISPYLPDLSGIVPGFGRFSPCPWGLGPEIHGLKDHWMGEWPENSFGHFGQSGACALMHAPTGLFIVATSTVPFGPWAVALWPTWTSSWWRWLSQ